MTSASRPPRDTLVEIATRARHGASQLARTRTEQRNRALLEMATTLRSAVDLIVTANDSDVSAARQQDATSAMIDRLTLSPARVEAMARSLEEVAALPDPLGRGCQWTRPNGLEISRVHVPLGVIAIIYEGRPNVTVEAASLALKAGNAVILRGSSGAQASNRLLTRSMQQALKQSGLCADCIQAVEDMDRDVIDELCRMNGLIDVIIPRGGAALIQRVVQNATVPVIETGIGNCHVYVDDGANLETAERIVINAKTQRPGVCNAAESLLVHRSIAAEFLPRIGTALKERGVEIRACPESLPYLAGAAQATDDDFAREFLDLIISVKVVDSVEKAIEHIDRFGTHHSEAIVTDSHAHAQLFIHVIDAAAVYVNASTRFTDGGEFGFGGEMGISTQKLHARGPLGPDELTTCKYVVVGDGQVRA